MSVSSIGESRFPAQTTEEGISVTKAIWRDMLSFDGYLAHELIEDLDQPGHLIGSFLGEDVKSPGAAGFWPFRAGGLLSTCRG